MHILPMLYYASRQDSLLWHAVRAMAFADTSPARSGGGLPFNLKARRSYGLTLARLREVVEKKVELNEDHVFAALLLLDSFEVRSFEREWHNFIKTVLTRSCTQSQCILPNLSHLDRISRLSNTL
jgi:hypothetical protein